MVPCTTFLLSPLTNVSPAIGEQLELAINVSPSPWPGWAELTRWVEMRREEHDSAIRALERLLRVERSAPGERSKEGIELCRVTQTGPLMPYRKSTKSDRTLWC